MHQTLSEFIGCNDWDNDELCGLIDKQHDDIKARDELIRDVLNAFRANCGGYMVRQTLKGFKERLQEFGIEV